MSNHSKKVKILPEMCASRKALVIYFDLPPLLLDFSRIHYQLVDHPGLRYLRLHFGYWGYRISSQVFQGSAVLPATYVAVIDSQIQQHWHKQSRNHDQRYSHPSVIALHLGENPHSLSNLAHQQAEQSYYDPKKIQIVFFTYTVVHKSAVVVKLLSTSITFFAVIAKTMYISLAYPTPSQHIPIVIALLKRQLEQSRVNWVNADQFHIIVGH